MKNNTRRQFLKKSAAITGLFGLGLDRSQISAMSQPTPKTVKAHSKSENPNIVMIVVDDMDAGTPACFGGKTPEISPNIDKLAADGMRFEHAFVTVSVCQPSRAVWVTGRYPLHNGSMGFNPATKGIAMLGSELRKNGYFTALMGKAGHYRPVDHEQWDIIKNHFANHGRDPKVYKREMNSFLAKSKQSGKPYFLIMDIMDPHRPYPGSDYEKQMYKDTIPPGPSRVYSPDEVEIPGYMMDTPLVRRELSWYYNACKRADDIVGVLVEQLKAAGQYDDTIIMFQSDNGAALPFSKGSCYLQSNRTPLIVRWPGVTKPNSVDDEHFINGIDMMPTILDICGAPLPEHMDGSSFKPVLQGKKQPKRDHVVTVFHRDQYRVFEMRAMHTKKIGYIFNLWGISPWLGCDIHFLSNNKIYIMEEFADQDPELARRVEFYYHRPPEELYDYTKDPHSLNNLVKDPAYKEELEIMRHKMLQWMKETGDSNFHALTYYLKAMV